MENKEIIIAYKGFNQDWTCRGHQFEINKTYKHKGEVKACESGYHSCENPFDVWNYYPPSTSLYALVECDGEISKDSNGDSKIACGKLTIKAELKLPQLIEHGIKGILSKVDFDNKTNTNTGDWSAATNTGYESAATNTGKCSAATNTGDRSAAEVAGKDSVALAAGYKSKAKASRGSAIVCVYKDHEGNLIHAKAAIAGKDVKPDTWYMLDGKGNFVEVE